MNEELVGEIIPGTLRKTLVRWEMLYGWYPYAIRDLTQGKRAITLEMLQDAPPFYRCRLARAALMGKINNIV